MKPYQTPIDAISELSLAAKALKALSADANAIEKLQKLENFIALLLLNIKSNYFKMAYDTLKDGEKASHNRTTRGALAAWAKLMNRAHEQLGPNASAFENAQNYVSMSLLLKKFPLGERPKRQDAEDFLNEFDEFDDNIQISEEEQSEFHENAETALKGFSLIAQEISCYDTVVGLVEKYCKGTSLTKPSEGLN